MATSFLSNPKHWWNRAEATRAKAEKARGDQSRKQRLFRIAQESWLFGPKKIQDDLAGKGETSRDDLPAAMAAKRRGKPQKIEGSYQQPEPERSSSV